MSTLGILITLSVALDRANFDYRATGIKDFEVEAAKEWVRSALAAARDSQAQAAPAPDALRGYSAPYAAAKVRAYGDEIMRVWAVLAEAGRPADGDTRLADAVRAALSAAQPAAPVDALPFDEDLVGRIWHKASAAWGEAIGGPDELYVFAQYLWREFAALSRPQAEQEVK